MAAERQCAVRAIQTFGSTVLGLKTPSSAKQSTHNVSEDKDSLLPSPVPAEKTKLYLAYGSNLAASTFQGTRKVQPLRAINVHVPSLQLVFDLPGIPYVEPCFANSRQRNAKGAISPTNDLGWPKGLIGVVYEVTESDYAHIIATEGGGTTYADVQVDCYPLAADTFPIPSVPTGTPFKAHTLFADTLHDPITSRRRPDGWAEPSLRYLNLLRTGAAEHELPPDYRQWLQSLRHFEVTSRRQTLGKWLFLAMWMPFVLAVLALQRVSADKHGKVPHWVGTLMVRLFAAVWWVYDASFKGVFGEGERTVGDPFEGRDKDDT